MFIAGQCACALLRVRAVTGAGIDGPHPNAEKVLRRDDRDAEPRTRCRTATRPSASRSSPEVPGGHAGDRRFDVGSDRSGSVRVRVNFGYGAVSVRVSFGPGHFGCRSVSVRVSFGPDRFRSGSCWVRVGFGPGHVGTGSVRVRVSSGPGRFGSGSVELRFGCTARIRKILAPVEREYVSNE